MWFVVAWHLPFFKKLAFSSPLIMVKKTPKATEKLKLDENCLHSIRSDGDDFNRFTD